MRIIVFGPSGGTGRLLVDKALGAGHTVTAFARDGVAIAPRPNLSVVQGSVHDAVAVDNAVAGHDAVLSALGGRPWRAAPVCGPAIRNIAAAMTRHGVRRIVAMSTFGADETRPDVGFLPRYLLFGIVLRNEVADKEAMERHLRDTALDWVVARVNILTDAPAQGQIRAADDRTIRGMGRIARADVADFMLAQLASDTWLRRMPVIVG